MPSVLITGANRGIGLEFARQYAGDGWSVYACCRHPDSADELKNISGDVAVHQLDVRDRAAIKELAVSLSESLDLVIANAGVGGQGVGDFGSLDYDKWREVLEVNLFGATATCEAFAPLVEKAKGKMALLSSQMGSIADASGGAMAYRTSKTALNMAAKVIAAKMAAHGVAVTLFHPGWVETDMGGPNALISPAKSVAGMRRLIAEAQVTDSPKFLVYDGRELPW